MCEERFSWRRFGVRTRKMTFGPLRGVRGPGGVQWPRQAPGRGLSGSALAIPAGEAITCGSRRARGRRRGTASVPAAATRRRREAAPRGGAPPPWKPAVVAVAAAIKSGGDDNPAAPTIWHAPPQMLRCKRSNPPAASVTAELPWQGRGSALRLLSRRGVSLSSPSRLRKRVASNSSS